MTRTWTDGLGLPISAGNLNALEADVTTALGVPDAALATRVAAGATKTALDARYATLTALSGKEPAIATGTTTQYLRGDKSWQELTPTAVGLNNVNNTSDLNKPVSTATQAALNAAVAGEAQIWAGWRTAVSNMGTRAAEWLCIGDSITEGTGVTVLTDTWPYKAASKLRSSFPAIAGNAKDSRGWSPIAGTSSSLVAPWTIALNGGNSATTSNFGFRFTKSQQIGVGATITGTVIGTSIDVWYTQGTTTTSFTVKVDGVLKGTYGGASAGGTTDGFVQRVALGTSGSHTVVITAGSGQSYINGVTVYDGNENSGIVVLNAGFHGSQTNVWNATANNALWKQNITTLNPDLVTIMLGANDYSSLLGRATFSSNLTNMVNVIRDNVAGWPTIGLIMPYKENYTYSPAYEQYEYGMERAAAAIGCAYLDLRTKMPDVGSAADTQGYYSDAIHPNATGNDKIATEISNWLVSHAT